MEAVGVGSDAAHRVHGDRAADDLVMLAAPHVGPLDGQLDGLFECHVRHFQRDAFDGLGRQAAFQRDVLRRIALVEIALDHDRHHGLDTTSVGRDILAEQRRGDVAVEAVAEGFLVDIPDQGMVVLAAQEQAVAQLSRRLHHQPGGVGVTHQEFVVEFFVLQQHVHHRHGEQTVHAGLDRQPFVGNGRIAGTHRIDGDELAAAALQLFQSDLDRVGRVVFRHAPHDEVLGVIPVGRTELPEREADGIQAGRRHVDRAEAAVCRPVGGAELLRPQAGQRLHLVASGKIAQFGGVGRADLFQAVGQGVERLVPGNRLVNALAALGARLAHQRLGQLGGGILFHDPGRALGAQHALVGGMVAVALDEADLVVLQRDLDAAAAGTHVAGGVPDFLRVVMFEFDLGVHAVPGFKNDLRRPLVFRRRIALPGCNSR